MNFRSVISASIALLSMGASPVFAQTIPNTWTPAAGDNIGFYLQDPSTGDYYLQYSYYSPAADSYHPTSSDVPDSVSGIGGGGSGGGGMLQSVGGDDGSASTNALVDDGQVELNDLVERVMPKVVSRADPLTSISTGFFFGFYRATSPNYGGIASSRPVDPHTVSVSTTDTCATDAEQRRANAAAALVNNHLLGQVHPGYRVTVSIQGGTEVWRFNGQFGLYGGAQNLDPTPVSTPCH